MAIADANLRVRNERLALAIKTAKLREERRMLEGSLSEFVRAGWGAFDSSQFQECWAMEALCEHLEAVTRGHIKRLLINFPPRMAKSSITSIAWPAWTWAQSEQTFVSGPNVRFLCGSYNHALSLKLSNASRRLLVSPFYQHYWGKRFALMSDQNTKNQYDTDKGGSRIATSVGGSLIGIGGDCIVVDDPHNTESVESEADRDTVLRWWKELSTTRLNDPKQSAIVVVMQRLHQNDVTGAILDGNNPDEWTHLMLPMRHDPMRHCVTVLKRDESGEPEVTWEDPRKETELLWPERFGEKEVREIETNLGPYMASGRLQQRPTPAGGGILKREWWRVWEEQAFPRTTLVVTSCDTAYTERESNDPTGCVTLGLFEQHGNTHVILMDAWRKRLELHIPNEWQEENTTEERISQVRAWKRAAWNEYKDAKRRGDPAVEPIIDENKRPWSEYIESGTGHARRWPGETAYLWRIRTQSRWGLCEWIAHSCRRFGTHHLLIEGKASGLSVAQEIRRLHAKEGWRISTPVPDGDKVARAYAVQGTLSSGVVYAPDREWAEMVIAETEVFPKGRYKDLTDALTQGLKFMRDNNVLKRAEERELEDEDLARQRPVSKPLY